MNIRKASLTVICTLGMAVLAAGVIGGRRATSKPRLLSASAPATPLPSDRTTAEQTIRYLEQRARNDSDDFIARNKLTTYYLQLVRETGDLAYLNLASVAAKSSLSSMPAEHNVGGLAAVTQVEFTSHEFESARQHAARLAELESDKSYPQQLLGDAFLELGDYDQAKVAFDRMEMLGSGQGLTQVAADQRIARMALLHGDPDSAKQAFERALAEALAMPSPHRETVAWCRWQLGETAFSVGDYSAAEKYYRDALTTFPDYFRAVASLGKVKAAQGDISGAIEQYQRAVYLLPDPSFVAALGDLYKLAGREKDADAQYKLVHAIAHLNTVSGSIYNRQQALFLADHDLNPLVAYHLAEKEYRVRRDIYGADALAWTALKAGKLPEAQSAIKDALRLGTKDARLFYHAGMIACAAHDDPTAKSYLSQALVLSPQFDPLQAPIARKTLARLGAR